MHTVYVRTVGKELYVATQGLASETSFWNLAAGLRGSQSCVLHTYKISVIHTDYTKSCSCCVTASSVMEHSVLQGRLLSRKVNNSK